MIKPARVTIISIGTGLVALAIGQAAFQEGFSWAAWLDSWSFSLLSMLLIIGLFIGFGALLYAVLTHFSNAEPREESSKDEEPKKKNQNAA